MARIRVQDDPASRPSQHGKRVSESRAEHRACGGVAIGLEANLRVLEAAFAMRNDSRLLGCGVNEGKEILRHVLVRIVLHGMGEMIAAIEALVEKAMKSAPDRRAGEQRQNARVAREQL